MPASLSDCASEITFTPTPEHFANYELSKTEDLESLSGFINGVNTRNRPVRFDLEATVIGEGILSGEYGHSVFCDLDNFETLSPCITTLTEKAKLFFPDYTFKELTQEDGAFFLKLSHKDGKYTAIINPTCSPTSPEKSSFENGSKLCISCSLNIFVNFETKSAGFFLVSKKIVIDGGKKKARR
jgi:hypothetical protein